MIKFLLFIQKLIINPIGGFKRKYTLVKNGCYVKYMPGAWAVGEDDIKIIRDEIMRYEQHGSIKYLEIGSGYSTLVVYKLLSEKFSNSKLVSLEADEEWRQHTLRAVENLEQNECFNKNNVSFVCEKTDHANDLLASCVAKHLKTEEFDIVFIDAPPDTSAVNARKKIVDQVLPMLKNKSTLIIHDTNRIDEMLAFESIRNRFMSSDIYNTVKGIGVHRLLK